MQLAQGLPQFKEQVYEKHKAWKDESEPACDLRDQQGWSQKPGEMGEERVWLQPRQCRAHYCNGKHRGI